ncbi:DUF4124 domain-containing protein [Chromatocurvus halotolerans]|uniref:DUF1570 domain-containing protein n=1 Tax=Chromatocurvus halotolerans TaxID=1132028 RepID=A0A4R2KV55_9GAMM|nr:DUF4124 domain-containing protein [Chromatocurvus halotolerans]TCO77703.1 hypothetical protein EV688_102160 [Chromatocurvus halotolerans]
MNNRFWTSFSLLFVIGLLSALVARQSFHLPFGSGFLTNVFKTDSTRQYSPDTARSLTQSATGSGTSNIALDHTANDAQACARPATKSRADTGIAVIYRWQDSDGVTHMADKAPVDAVASVFDISGSRRDFTYQIHGHGVALPMQFSGEIAAGSKRIFDIWHFLLGEERLRQVEITIRALEAEQFDALWAGRAPGAKPVNGFYEMSSNTAYVRYDSGMPRRAVATAFHEISHLITASHLGVTPPWLTEGLAEYAETMVVTDQTAAVSPNLAHLELLNSAKLPPLADFLAMDRTQWHGPQRHLHYAVAWSLAHHLMGSDVGRTALQALLREASDKFCQSFSASAVLASSYPGGLPRLESDWRVGIRTGAFGIHQT